MKKWLSLTFSLILCLNLVACNPPQEEKQSEIEESSTAEPSMEETKIESFNISADEILNALLDEDEYYVIDESADDKQRIITYASKHKTVFLKAYTAIDSDEFTVFTFISKAANSTVRQLMKNSIKIIENLLSNIEKNSYETDEATKDDAELYYIFAKDTDINYKRLPLKYRPDNDFFVESSNLENFKAHRQYFRFSEMEQMLSEYINNNNIKEDDSAIALKNTVDELIFKSEGCQIVHDEFEDTTTLNYRDINHVGESVFFVPFLKGSKYSTPGIILHIGFRKNGWVFFDRYMISPSNFDVLEYPATTIRNVISGGTIEEYVIAISEGENRLLLESIAESDSTSIRFENKDDDKNYDVTISDIEIQATRTVFDIYNLIYELSEVINAWEADYY